MRAHPGVVPPPRGGVRAAVAALVEVLLEEPVPYRPRSTQGIIRLADRHDAARLDAACARAPRVGDPAYRTVKGILVAGTEHEGTEHRPPLDGPAHLRGPDGLFVDPADDREAVG